MPLKQTLGKTREGKLIMPKQTTAPQEICLEGQPSSRGIAIGIPFILDSYEAKIPEITLTASEIEGEVTRYQRALKESHDDILRLKGELAREGVKDGVSVLEAHLQIVEDPLLNAQIEAEIRSSKKNAEFVFQKAIQRFRKKFQSLDDPFFQSRFEDVQDISKRVLGYLRDMKRMTLADVPHNSIVFSQTLSPSDAAEAKRQNVVAFVTQVGGSMSHTAIVAKAKGIPYVANVSFSKLNAMHKVELAICDGLTGKVILNPTEKTLQHYRRLKTDILEHDEVLRSSNTLKATTSDGHVIKLSANVEITDDFALLKQFGAEGVGLFRSEYMVLQRGSFPSEDEQYEIYKNLVEHADGHSVVIRAFDIGLDKVVCSLKANSELNPALGCRAIRFLLHEKELFKVQMRAVLRASNLGDVRILFPMISSLNELLDAKAVVYEAYEELKKEGHKISGSIKMGCMIEVPSAAMIVDLIAQECDFLSIGTNDLIQYSLAVDRADQSMSSLYTSTHPGVMRLIRIIVREAKRKRIPVSVCGELASDPRFVPLLLGLGIKELSVSCRFLPVIKHMIRSTERSQAEALAKHVLTLKTAHEIHEVLRLEYQKHGTESVLQSF
jgi:phosphoenolpyruvate-protein phosphotransferase (PTS system enzyme I)